MSEKKAKYDVFKGLLNAEQVNTLSSSELLSCVQARTCSDLGQANKHYLLHDGCDIRKPDSKAMEYLGKVMSLSKHVINGYQTMNSVVVNPDNQSVSLLCHEIYSNKLPAYIGQMTLNNSQLMAELSDEKRAFFEANTHVNTKILYKKNLEKSSELLKSNPIVQSVCHCSDREFDDDEIYEYIDQELKDTFVTRLKADRKSHETFYPLTPTGKISKTPKNYKIVDKTFRNSSVYDIETLVIKGKKYQNIQSCIEWESLKINNRTYTVVRITLLDKGKAIFAQPMLLLTNEIVKTAQDAKQIYMTYLLRAKIEVVFKFLKQNLGWESIQVRDFNSIKNLLALAFFLVGYFPELEQELKAHPIALKLCKLAKSKGKVTMHFLLLGLEILANFQKVSIWMNQNDISNEQINEILALITADNPI